MFTFVSAIARLRRLHWSNVPKLVFVGAWCAASVLVFGWILMSALKTTNEIFSNIWSLPTSLHFENFADAWSNSDLATATLNSVVVVGSATLINLSLSAPAAYVLSRARLRGMAPLRFVFVLGIGIPVQGVLIPLFVFLAKLGFIDTLYGLVVAYVATSIPFTVYLLTGFFRSLPFELEEAAALDGATPLRTFWSIVVPVAMPGIITAGIFNLVALWSEFFLALTIINSNSHYTLPLAIVNLYGNMKYTGDWSGLFAGVIIVVLPITLAYAFLSRRLMEGLTLGAVK